MAITFRQIIAAHSKNLRRRAYNVGKTEFPVLKKRIVRLLIVITSPTEGIRRTFCERGAEPSSSVIYAEFLDQQTDYQIVRYLKLVYLLSARLYGSQSDLNRNTQTNSTRFTPQTQMGISSSILQVIAVLTDRQIYRQTNRLIYRSSTPLIILV